jgi:hypothetical protein
MMVARSRLAWGGAIAGASIIVLAATRLAASDASPCTGAVYHQFDFFLGDWDAYDVADTTVVTARNHVTSMLDGCAIREVYEQNDGLRGESYTAYDASRHVWHQSWVTNRGQLLLLDGYLEQGRLVLTAVEHNADGTESLLRGKWWRDGQTVHERAERSKDRGVTWAPVFNIVFRPHR